MTAMHVHETLPSPPGTYAPGPTASSRLVLVPHGPDVGLARVQSFRGEPALHKQSDMCDRCGHRKASNGPGRRQIIGNIASRSLVCPG